MKHIQTFFLSQPRWYLALLGLLFVAYVGAWGYTIHVAQLERAAGYTPVIPVAEHDSTSYANLAHSILQGHFAERAGEYEYFHTPGYPAFVAVILFLTGSYFVATFIQVLLVFAIALMTYILGTQLASPSVGRWASLLFLVNPLTPTNALWIATDTLFTFLLILGFTLVCTQFKTRPLITTLVTAALFAAAIYVRPVGFIAYPILVAPMFALAYPWRKKIGYAALMLCVITLLLVPWLIRNYSHSGVFSFTSLVAFNMTYYSIPHYWLDTEHLRLEDGIARAENESGVKSGIAEYGYPATWYDLKSSPKLSAFYQKVVFAAPVNYVVWHLYYSTGFFFAPPLTPPSLSLNIKALIAKRDFATAIYAITHPLWFFAERIAMLAGLLLLVLGAWSMRRNWLAMAFVLVILYLAALGGPSTAARYRIPVEPFLSVFMVVGGVYLWSVSRKIMGIHDKPHA